MPDFNTVPNQKIVNVHRDMPKGSEEPFLTIKAKHLFEAYQKLKTIGALALYLYFSNNKDGYTFALSPKAIESKIGIPQSTISDNIPRLIGTGYLVKEGESNIYDFYETPHTNTESVKPSAKIEF